MPQRTSFSKLFSQKRRERCTRKKRVSLRDRERKKRDARRKTTKKSAERATIYVFKRAPPRSRARQEKKRERGKRFAFSLRSRGPFAGREKKKKKKKKKEGNARKKEELCKRTHVDVNSSASLRTGRSNTLKSKFKDVMASRCSRA